MEEATDSTVGTEEESTRSMPSLRGIGRGGNVLSAAKGAVVEEEEEEAEEGRLGSEAEAIN